MAKRTSKAKSTPTRKEIDWTEDRVNMISSLYLNGYSDEDVAKLIPCAVSTLKYRINQHSDVKVRFEESKSLAIANATKSLQKIAEGYFEDEVTTGVEFKARVELMTFIKDLLMFVPEEDLEGYQEKADKLLAQGEVLKTVKKWYPPQKDAINKILDAHQPETWDAEAKRKKIPQVKINVTMEGKMLPKAKEVVSDYEVIDSK